MTGRTLNLGQRTVPLGRPLVMGVLNVTPDSFSDGGQFFHFDSALAHAQAMIEQGADIIDVGGESTRPGASVVTPEQECERVVPVIEAIRSRFDVPITIDTSQPMVIRAAVSAGADMINDARALQVDGAIGAVVETGVSAIMYHMHGTPSTMKFVHQAEQFDGMTQQPEPVYHDVVQDIKQFFVDRIKACAEEGLSSDRLLIDPGFCFGKTFDQNIDLLANLHQFHDLKLPICVGMSRKSFIGRIVDCEVDERLYGTIATSVLAAQQGVAIIRVHDVRPTVDAIKVVQAVSQKGVLI